MKTEIVQEAMRVNNVHSRHSWSSSNGMGDTTHTVQDVVSALRMVSQATE